MHPTRDFNYISDTVDGFIAAAKSERVVGQVLNIGSNFEVSIGETLDLIAGIMQAEVEVQTDDARIRPATSEVERLWADNRKALEMTAWRPAYAGREGFRRGLAETVAWFAQPENRRHYDAVRYSI